MTDPALDPELPPGSQRLFDGSDALRRRPPSRLKTRLVPAVLALVAAAGIVVLSWAALRYFFDTLTLSPGALDAWRIVLVVIGIGLLGFLVPGILAVVRAVRAGRFAKRGEMIEARISADKAKDWIWYVGGIGLTILIVDFFLYFLSVNDGIIRTTYLDWSLIWESRRQLWKGFWLNIRVFMVAEVLILPLSLLLAVARMFPGRPGAPVRALAIAYTDVFRGFPALVVIYLFVLGIQLADLDTSLPIIGGFNRDDRFFWLITFSLVIVYVAYVGEVYRAGLESVHWSQTAASRSLGLSHAQSLRHVVVPQAVRRIIPPLLNDFIALQKDTALLSTVGALEVVARARLIANQEFNLSPIFGAGLCFLIITIPMARATDWLIKRDKQRTQAGVS